MIEVQINKKLSHFTLEINFNFDNGILAIVGPSGAGKSTLLQCIGGLQKPNEGSIVLNNTCLFSSKQNIDIPARNRNIGYVFQDYALFPHMTVEKNILYGKPKTYTDDDKLINYHELLDHLNITHLKNKYPLQISGGEKQRVALARAIMSHPQILLLDEPLSALDLKIRKMLQQELKKLHERWQIPFLLVTHDMEEANYLGNKIIKIENGKQFI